MPEQIEAMMKGKVALEEVLEVGADRRKIGRDDARRLFRLGEARLLARAA